MVTAKAGTSPLAFERKFGRSSRVTFQRRHLLRVVGMASALSAFFRYRKRRKLRLSALASPALEPSLAIAPALTVEEQLEVCLQPVTQAYPAHGYFTGVRSSIVVPQTSAAVFESLSRNLELVFEPIVECDDVLKEGDGFGCEKLHRHVRIPFTISYFTGNIHLNMEVENNRPLGQITFQSLSSGRFLSKLVATFYIRPSRGVNGEENTSVELDSKITVSRLPPPPLKGLVKGVITRKMDRCMQDLAAYHSGGFNFNNEY